MQEIDPTANGVMVFPESFDIYPTSQQRQTDMSGFLQEAIDTCLQNQIGTLKLQPGLYPIENPLVIHSSRLTITSTGEAKASLHDAKRVPIIKLMKDAPYGVLIANNGLTNGDKMIGGIVLKNIAIRSVGNLTRMGLLTLYNAHNCEVTKCYIGGEFTPGGVNAEFQHIDTRNAHQGHLVMMLADRTPGSKAVSWLNRLSYCYLHWALRKGLIMESSDSWIERNYISHTAGVAENDHSGNEYAGNHIDNTRGLGDETGLSFVERNPAAISTDGTSMIHGNYFDIHKTGVQLANQSKGTVITANHFRACKRTYIDLNSAEHISVTANSFRKNPSARFKPIIARAPKHITISSNSNFNRFDRRLKPFLWGNTLNET